MKIDFKGEFFDFAKDLVVIILIVLFVRTFLFQPFQISGQSMYASYYDKEFLIVDVFSYLDIPYIKKADVHRGDVVVFRPKVSDDKEYFIKRIIGLPGDSIKIEDGKVYLKKQSEADFVLLDEDDYLTDENNNHTSTNSLSSSYTVPAGKYFLMGDNRNHSSDSRSCFYNSCLNSPRDAYISKDDIIGRVVLDLGYFNFRKFTFVQPELGISTTPKFFSSLDSYTYK